MGRLVYDGIMSLDGYLADPHGAYDFAEPDEDVFAACSDDLLGQSLHIYGRRMYEQMTVWQTLDRGPDVPESLREFARRWQRLDKIVVSRSLSRVDTARTRLVPAFDAAAVRGWVSASAGDVAIGGPTLAGAAVAAGLVDEFVLYLLPVAIGGGLPYFPAGVRAGLEQIDVHRYAGGAVRLRYRPAPSVPSVSSGQ